MLDTLETDIAVRRIKGVAHGILAVGGLGAVHRVPRKQGSQLGDGDAVNLFAENVVESLPFDRNLSLESESMDTPAPVLG